MTELACWELRFQFTDGTIMGHVLSFANTSFISHVDEITKIDKYKGKTYNPEYDISSTVTFHYNNVCFGASRHS